MQSRFNFSNFAALKYNARTAAAASKLQQRSENSSLSISGLQWGTHGQSSGDENSPFIGMVVGDFQYKDDLDLDYDPDGHMETDDVFVPIDRSSFGENEMNEVVNQRLENRRFAEEKVYDPLLQAEGDGSLVDQDEMEWLIYTHPVAYKMKEHYKFGDPQVYRRPQETIGFPQFSIPYMVTLEEFAYSSYNVCPNNGMDWAAWDAANRVDDERLETFVAQGVTHNARLANPHSSDQVLVSNMIFGEDEPSKRLTSKEHAIKNYGAVDDSEAVMRKRIQHTLNLQAADKTVTFKKHNGNKTDGVVVAQDDLVGELGSHEHIENSDSFTVNGKPVVVYAKGGEYLLKDLQNAHLKDFRNFLWKLRCGRQVYDLADYIHKDIQILITRELKAIGKLGDGDWLHRSQADDEELVETLIRHHPDGSDPYSEYSFEDRVKFMAVPKFDPMNAFGSLNGLSIHLEKIYTDMTEPERTPGNIKIICKLLEEKFKVMHRESGYIFAEFFHKGGYPETYELLSEKILKVADMIHKDWLKKQQFDGLAAAATAVDGKKGGGGGGNYQNQSNNSQNNGGNSSSRNNNHQSNNQRNGNGSGGGRGGGNSANSGRGKNGGGGGGNPPTNLKEHPQNGTWAACHGCGKYGHNANSCPLSGHPDFNHDHNKVAFDHSPAWAVLQETAKAKGIKLSCLSDRLTAAGRLLPDAERHVGAKSKHSEGNADTQNNNKGPRSK